MLHCPGNCSVADGHEEVHCRCLYSGYWNRSVIIQSHMDPGNSIFRFPPAFHLTILKISYRNRSVCEFEGFPKQAALRKPMWRPFLKKGSYEKKVKRVRFTRQVDRYGYCVVYCFWFNVPLAISIVLLLSRLFNTWLLYKLFPPLQSENALRDIEAFQIPPTRKPHTLFPAGHSHWKHQNRKIYNLPLP